MTRNFGSPRCIGATTPGAPSPRVAVSREPIQLAGKTSRPANSRSASPELSIANARYRAMEFGAMCFGVGFAAFIGAFFCAAMWAVSLVLYYGGSDSPF